MKQGSFFEESNGKKDLVFSLSTRYDKMIFALLDEIIIVYIRLTLVYVGVLALKNFFQSLLW